tara:strand:+ start:2607 stop:4157 length:1551 start_codon:yes stop_codon:yes gene_type:complete
MKSLITSNFNLIEKSSIWKILKDRKNYKFDEYNNFNFSLNNQSFLNKFNNVFLILYVNDLLEKKTFSKFLFLLNKIAKRNKDKKFFLILLKKKLNNQYLDKENNLSFFKSFKSLDVSSNNINLININDKNIKFNLRNYYYIRCPLDLSSFKTIIKKINSSNEVKLNKPFKMIILDCDNTLWGGVVGEDGIQSIRFGEDGDGKIFEDIQKYLKFLKNNGFLLSIASKNNEKIVWDTFKKRNMPLKKNDFVSAKINWNEKYSNILNTLNSLSLRSEDVIFIDDNFIEISKVKKYIKKINTYKINDLSDYIKFIYENKRLQVNNITKEDKKKYYQYKIRDKFENLKTKISDKKLYKKLNQKINFINVKEKNINRTQQLFNKVNQFNFTTNRYKISDIEKIQKKKGSEIKLVSFKDKFGDHGIVGLYKLNFEKNIITISDFLLSCRIINRKVEDYMIFYIAKKFKNKKIQIKFIENKNNKELINIFLKKKFFEKIKKKNSSSYYKILMNNELINAKHYFK